MRSTGEDGERPTGNAALGLLTKPHMPVNRAVVPELGALTHNEPVTLRRVFGRRSRRVVLFVGDLVTIAAAQVVGHWLAGDTEGLGTLLERGMFSADGFAAVVAEVSTVVLLALYRGYRDLHRPYMELVRDVVTAALWSVLLTMAALYLYVPSRGVSRAAEVIAGVLTAISLCGWRIPFARSIRACFTNPGISTGLHPRGFK